MYNCRLTLSEAYESKLLTFLQPHAYLSKLAKGLGRLNICDGYIRSFLCTDLILRDDLLDTPELNNRELDFLRLQCRLN